MPNFLKKNFTVDEFWDKGKNTILADPKALFKKLIDPQTKDAITGKRISKVKKLISNNEDSWNDKEMKNASEACYILFLWVECIISYNEINIKTQPIRDKLKEVT